MAHTVREKSKLLARVRRMRGQLEAVERALETERSCSEVLQLLTATRGAMNGLMAEVIEGHIHEHIAATDCSDAERRHAANELIDVVRTYLK